MTLTPGASIGVYEITAHIGSGGMGEVYKARDTRLDRTVAIKILPEAFAADSDRVARFQREAKTLAVLNHPNIAQIFGLEEADDVHALAMEFVAGEDLSERIARGPIPIDEVLPVARQIAEALAAAHEQGIIHRDLKPANIKVTPDGRVKVLDFGLAKAIDPPASSPNVSQSPTITTPAMTQAGMIIGTAAYMSPEQAKGRPADKRSDVWAFGCVLYEMLTGRRAFQGEDVSDTLASVLKSDPDWNALPSTLPESIRSLLEGSLKKDRRERIGDVSTAHFLLNHPQAMVTSSSSRPPAPQRVWRGPIPIALAAIVGAALAGVGGWQLKPLPPHSVTRLAFNLPEGQSFSPAASLRHLIAVSPDGAQMVYAANTRLYLRSMSELDAHAIQGTEGYQLVTDPVFSPDSRSVAFYARADQTLKRIAVTGGAAVTICQAEMPFGISWGPDAIVFGQGRKGVMRVSPDGGTPEVLGRIKDGEEAHGPQLLPDGRHLLFTLATVNARDRWDKARIVVQSIPSGERTTLIDGGSDGRYVQTGHILYALSGRVYAIPFDLQRLQVKGAAVPLVAGVRRSPGGTTGTAQFSVSSTGSLIYVPGPIAASSALLDIALIDRQGQIERLKLPSGPYWAPRVSPDGTRLAFGVDDGHDANIDIYDLSGSAFRRRLTFGGSNRFPTWSADGTHVAFQSDRDGDLAIFWQPADGSTATAERLTTPSKGEAHTPEAWSPTSDRLLFTITKASDVSLWTLSLHDKKAVTFGEVHSPTAIGGTFSPDGRWLAYTGTERGKTTVYAQPFPAGGSKYQLFPRDESDSPHEVVWSADGKELFYNPRAGDFEAVRVTTEPTFAFGSAVALPRPFQLSPVEARRAYDVTTSGKFVGLIPVGQPEGTSQIASQIQVVLNWFEELKRLAPTK